MKLEERRPEESSVRPLLEPTDDSDVPARARTIDPDTRRTVVIALGALAVGFLLGATSWQTGDADVSPETPTTLTAGGPSGDVGSLIDTTTSSTTSTTVRTTTTTEPRPTLAAQAPVMGGRSLVGVGNRGAFRWSAGSSTPTIVATGQEAEGEWDRTGRYLALLRSWNNDGWGELWVRAGGSMRPAHLHASGYTWHPSEPNLAFLGRQTVDGPTQLHVAHVTPASGIEIVRALPIPETAIGNWPWIIGWGDWGFLITGDLCEVNGDCTQSLTAIDPNGEILGRLEGAAVVSVSPSGQILLTDHLGEHDLPRNLRWTDPTFGTVTPADLPPNTDVWNIQWAPDGSAYTMNYYDQVAGVGKNVLVRGDTTTELPGIGWITGFSPDGQLILGMPDGGSNRRVFIIDTATVERYEITLPWEPWYVKIGGR